jgi:hypothetical protein
MGVDIMELEVIFWWKHSMSEMMAVGAKISRGEIMRKQVYI